MNSIVEAKVRDLLLNWYHYDPIQAQTAVVTIRDLARAAGHDLDGRFAHAGLGAGPECRVATGIVDRATLGGGCETSDYAIRKEIDYWLLHRAPVGGMSA